MDIATVSRRRSLGALYLSLRAGGGVVAGLAAAGVAAGAPAPLSLMLFGAAAVADWACDLTGSEDRLEGFAVGALVGLAATKGVFAGADWQAAGCRALTGDAWCAGMGLALAPLGTALLARRVTGRAHRLAAAAVLAGCSLAVAIVLAPDCFAA